MKINGIFSSGTTLLRSIELLFTKPYAQSLLTIFNETKSHQ